MQFRGPSIPGLALVALVLAGAVLLILGFGVAVGIGVLIGVVLGFIAVIAGMVLAQRHGMGGSWSISGPGVEHDVEEMRRFGEAAMRVADVDSSSLERVIPIGESVEASGVRVELLSLEIRATGAIASFATRTAPPISVPAHFVEATVSDDRGTEYVASGQSTQVSSPSAARFEVRCAPAPQSATLTIRIERFPSPFPNGPAPINGPWVFTVAAGGG